jgi:acetoin:2,6-dichlorophenolindophenol oxidoreductase subunit beta
LARTITGAEAINEGLIQIAEANPKVLFLAEGVQDPSAFYGTLVGIDRFDKSRLIEMPLSENGLLGVAIGVALKGYRPVVCLQRVEFALLALEQIIDNAAKIHYATEGRLSVPIVIRLVIGRGWGQGPQHSQSLEQLFAAIPGLKVVTPTFPDDSKGLIISAVEENNPVIFIEHRWCHYVEGEVAHDKYSIPIGVPRKVRSGSDITLVSTSFMTIESLIAARYLSSVGIEVDLFDIRTVKPINTSEIFLSIKGTGRLVTVDIGHVKYGIGAEIIAEIMTKDQSLVKHNVIRLGLPDHPVPSSRSLVVDTYPTALSIFSAVAKSFNIESKKIEQKLLEISNERSNVPNDIPHPSFTGPF